MFAGPNPKEQLLIVLFFVSMAISLLVYLPFLFHLMRCLQKVHPRNRVIPPWSVWLMLVPFLNILWRFFLVNFVATSLRREYEDRRLPVEDDFCRLLGNCWGVISLLTYLPFLIIGGCWNLPCAALFVLYWFRLGGYNAELFETEYSSAHDDRDRRRRTRDYNRYDEDDEY
jgi:hypothetical protein